MVVEDYDQIREWVIRVPLKVFYLHQWLGIESRDWQFLYRFGGKPIQIVHAPIIGNWSIGDPIPDAFFGLCRMTNIEEKKSTAGQFRQLCVCEIIPKEDYAQDLKKVFADPPVYVFEFVHYGDCQ